MKFLKQTLITLLMLTISNIAFAGQGPTDFLKSINKQIQPLLTNADKNNSKIVGLVNKMLDFEALCKESLGKHWDEHSPAEQAEFSNTLKALIEQNVISRLKKTDNNLLTYKDEKIKGQTAKVVTTVKDGEGPRAAEIEIVYEMAKKGNTWIVVDIVTDGMSLVSNYRSQFNKMIKQDGWDNMIQKMKDKLEK